MMSARIFTCWVSLSILLGFVFFVRGEHFFLPKENNVFSNDLQDDWIPVSGIDKRSTRPNHGFTQMVHITPPVRYPNQPLNQHLSASNKIEVFAQPPPILGSFSEFGHATIEAREPAHALNFRPSYNFDRSYEEIEERRYQQNDFHESSEEQKPPSIVVFNAQQRHPQNYHKIAPPQSQPQPFYQNYQHHNNHNNHNLNNNHNPINNNHNPINNHSPNHNQHKNHGFKEPAPNVHELAPPKRLSSYYVPNDRIYPRPPGNNKQVYAEQRPKPFLVTPAEPIQQQQQKLPQHQQQQQTQPQQQQFKPSVEAGESSGYFQKYPGIVENQKLFPEISHFARPFEQTNNDHSVFIKPNQFVHNLNVGTEVRFGVQEQGNDQPLKSVSSLDLPPRPAVPLQELPKRPAAIPSEFSVRPSTPLDLSTNSAGFTHPATRPFSKFQTQSPKNEELYRIFPVKEVNALPTFLPTPVTLVHQPKLPYFKEMVVNGGSSEYDTHEELDENDSSEQYDILKSPTKPMVTSTTTTSTTTTTTPAPRTTRKRKPSTTTTTTVAPPSDDYEEYVAVPNRQQLQLQEQQQEYQPQRDYYQHHRPAAEHYETMVVTTTTEAAREERPVPLPVSVNKYKKKKPFPVSRPKEPQQTAAVDFGQDEVPERPVTFTQSPTTTTTTTEATTTTTTTSAPPQSSSVETVAVTESRPKTKAKYGNGTRPRFSIKDYKTSTTSTTTTTTERPRSSLISRRTTTTTAATPETDAETVVDQQQTTIAVKKVYKPRVRPNRYKQASTATTTTTTTTTEEPQQQLQETTTERSGAAYRSKYKPGKYLNRLRTSTEAITVQDETFEQVAATEPARPAVYSAKRRTVPSTRTAVPPPAMVTIAESEYNAVRRSSSVSPPIETYDSAASSESMMDAASSEDVDVATTVAATLPASPRHKYHTSYVAERPLLPIESFFQSSMAGKQRRHHHERR